MSRVIRTLAIDMGSSSVRGIVGAWDTDSKKLTRSEVFRAEHHVCTDEQGNLYWDLEALKDAATQALHAAGDIDSVAVDGWGVDFVVVDENNNPLSQARSYRDSAGARGRSLMASRMPEAEQYHASGVLPQDINSVYRLALQPPSTGTVMFLPDFIARCLLDQPTQAWASRGIASTSGLLAASHEDWSEEILATAGIDRQRLPSITSERRVIGTRSDGVRVIAAGSHDTACALSSLSRECGYPEDAMFISCGSWSVVGAQTSEAVVTEEAYSRGVTNEATARGDNRAELNLTGLWVAQECRRAWGNPSYEELNRLLADASNPGAIIDVCDPRFSAPGDMPDRVVQAAREHNVTLSTRGEILRVVFDSIARAQADAIHTLRTLTGSTGKTYVMGGGVKNLFLMQRTAAALGESIHVTDPEATALGNIINQLLTLNVPPADLAEWVRNAGVITTVCPTDD
ncbi:rhamnulokinase family protein [Corynebacterium sp. TAE3-ERU30]|uniref:rhamnulokinase n=1 Tax=Corynebacterium sp. TAE3-ERU30 TaxID=2849496 RepID=UPI001C488FD0|nr:FGGY-family carbohydrate kinase [Corynebacterium sp. TAE3-ERU30]MBV7281277.1 hypothetical protein [Corynebacterium sp. TAE3-ERU30]